jgi:hypothetical protein
MLLTSFLRLFLILLRLTGLRLLFILPDIVFSTNK